MPKPTVLNRHETNHQATAALFDYILRTNRGTWDQELIIRLLDQGADIMVTDKCMANNTIIMWTIANTNIKNFERLLNILQNYYKDCPEIITAILNMVDETGKTALFLSIMKGWQHKDNDKINDPARPFMQYATKTLIENGADVNLRDNFGNSPLHIAVMRRDIEAIEYLISYGSDLTLENKLGLTPFQMIRHDYDEVCEFVSKGCVVYTMQDQESFYANYQNIKSLFIGAGINADLFDNEDPSKLFRTKIKKLISDMHLLFKNNAHKIITKDDVLQLMDQEQIKVPPKLNASLDTLITKVNKENATFKICGYANRILDYICQFLKALFGKDRESVIKEECRVYTKTLEDIFKFTPLYNLSNQQKNQSGNSATQNISNNPATMTSPRSVV